MLPFVSPLTLIGDEFPTRLKVSQLALKLVITDPPLPLATKQGYNSIYLRYILWSYINFHDDLYPSPSGFVTSRHERIYIVHANRLPLISKIIQILNHCLLYQTSNIYNLCDLESSDKSIIYLWQKE